MSSTKWPNRLERDAADAIGNAVATVAERSFFAVTDRCYEEEFAKMAAATGRWIVATVRFTEGDCPGVLVCTLPEELAHGLFHAFAGEDPLDPPPAAEQLFDLVGEFANMICGTWLTRLAGDQTFTLAHPSVAYLPDGSQPAFRGATGLFAVNDLPLAVGVCAQAAAEPSAAAGRE